ncbi:SDR family NAD(P)-dependent oxidoreductase [Zoogloea sp. LCSB751]|uniref:SDR family NAD(P)-dependent oxidoreductase n=1 Tax=Zoogloea sp. LCSB751 TaxID=1965277 RepID=UPI0009A4FCFC|nr:SDR family oxidoreductase [Zoogloea sp. LCSB751]
MDLQLLGKHALVTGSTAGIGFATAQRLAAEGVAVTLNGRSTAGVDAAVQRLRALLPGARVDGIAADLAGPDGAALLAERCEHVDILVNNLGIYEPKPFQEISDADWLRLFDVNVMSGVRLSRVAFPAMKRRGFGRIIFVSSESGLNPPPEMIHYGMTKAAQLSIARALAEASKGSAVTVNAVLPGPTRTEGSRAFTELLAREQGIDEAQVERNYFAEERPASLLGRFIDPAEVAATITYLCSPLAAATNGSSVRVDGGIVRSIV